MPIVFSAITPHPKKDPKATKTIEALKELEGELYMAKPDTIFIISPHSPISTESFSINLSSEFKNFETKQNYNCDIETISKIKEMSDLEFQNIPVNIINIISLIPKA